jgi:molecular chaperone GrpE
MIEVMDNLGEALLYAEGDMRKGLEQTMKRFDEILEKYNVKKIVVNVGDKFDPVLHEAVEGTGEAIDKIVREGYKIYDRVLRPSRVKVK